ncbi:unnamed protein product [Rhizoctonia solani]|uniref:NADP-dependent oxidoreductase domain-containing protein n=1 Tax=Rhizoctonia solani TaxID=456999 RepID=A0A8H2XVH0_9AGAM|nr:unnamed protein product [Rhizoctonia solani]
MALDRSYTLNDGRVIPAIGLGTFLSKPDEVTKAVEIANEHEVGIALSNLKKSNPNFKREDLWLTGKTWNSFHRQEYITKVHLTKISKSRDGKNAVRILPLSTNPVNLDIPEVALDTELSCTEVWKLMIQLRETGKVKSIGVSNFPVRILKTIIAETGVVPAVNQVEAHPLLLQDDLVEYCKEQNIHISAYAPLGGNNLQGELRIIDHEVVKKLASELGKTPAQVLIAYGVKRGYSVLPKSVNESRIRSNFEDFELPDDAYNQLVELGRKQPLRYNIPVNFSPRWSVNIWDSEAEKSATHRAF